MNCSEADVLVHALLDGEIDASHAREVEAHIATCADCARKLATFRSIRQAIAAADLKETAPASLRRRIEATLPNAAAGATDPVVTPLKFWRPSRRSFTGGFAVGAVASAAAASLLVIVARDDHDERTAAEVVSAHLRSLQPGHLTDVETSDQHTVKPWFNGKLDMAPPVIDLTAQGFTLIGGRLDDVDGETAAAIVYRRRQHVINLFVVRQLGAERAAVIGETRHGFNLRHWTDSGLGFWAVSDIGAGELDEFCKKFTAALHPAVRPS
jgi:mycothiol system anti-sigma-R factor